MKKSFPFESNIVEQYIPNNILFFWLQRNIWRLNLYIITWFSNLKVLRLSSDNIRTGPFICGMYNYVDLPICIITFTKCYADIGYIKIINFRFKYLLVLCIPAVTDPENIEKWFFAWIEYCSIIHTKQLIAVLDTAELGTFEILHHKMV